MKFLSLLLSLGALIYSNHTIAECKLEFTGVEWEAPNVIASLANGEEKASRIYYESPADFHLFPSIDISSQIASFSRVNRSNNRWVYFTFLFIKADYCRLQINNTPGGLMSMGTFSFGQTRLYVFAPTVAHLENGENRPRPGLSNSSFYRFELSWQ